MLREGDNMRTCSLCGGKLDANKRCTFCGLDNTKNDDMYKHLSNQNDCSGGPLTHVHEESVSKKTSTTKRTDTYSSAKYAGQKKTQRTKQVSKKSGVATVIGIIAVIATLGSSIFELVENIAIDDYEYSYSEEVDVEYDPYESVIRGLPESGMTYSVTLEPGIYHVGTHIPEGTYRAEVVQGNYGMVEIQDLENGIYLYENIGFDDEQMIVDDLRLYQNGFFTVSTGVIVEITAENVQTTELVTTQSTLTTSYVLTGEAVAGKDFPAGVYNIVYNANNGVYEFGEFQYIVPMGDFEYELSVFFDGSVGAETYYNVVLTEGTEVKLEDLEEVTLVPCGEIPTISYDEYYKLFY